MADDENNIWIKLGLDEGSFYGQLDYAKEEMTKFSSDITSQGKTIDDMFKLSAKQLGKMGEQISAVGKDIDKAWAVIDPIANENREAIKQLQTAYEDLGKSAAKAFMQGDDGKYRELQDYQREIGGVLNMYKDVEKEIDKYTNQLIEQEKTYNDITQRVEENGNAQIKLRTQLMQVKGEMQQMVLAAREHGGESEVAAVKSSEAYGKLQDKARDLTRTIQEVNKETQMLASNSSTLQGITSGLQGVVGGFSAVTGVMAMFGTKSEELQKVQTRVQGCIAAMMGLQRVMDTLKKSSAFMIAMTKWKTALMGVAGGAKTATGAFKALSAAIKANPFGLALTAITGLVTALGVFAAKSRKTAEDVAKEMKEMADKIKNSLSDIEVKVKVVRTNEESKEKLKKLSEEWAREFEQQRNELLRQADELYAQWYDHHKYLGDSDASADEAAKNRTINGDVNGNDGLKKQYEDLLRAGKDMEAAKVKYAIAYLTGDEEMMNESLTQWRQYWIDILQAQKDGDNTTAKLQDDVRREEIAAMKDGLEKKLAELDYEKEQEIAKIDEIGEELKKARKAAGLGDGLTTEQEEALNKRKKLVTDKYDNKKNDARRDDSREKARMAKEYKDKLARLTKEYEDALHQYHRDVKKIDQQSEWEMEQIGIDGMDDGLAKTIRQLKLNHEKELVQIKEQEEEKIEQWRQMKAKEWAAQHPKQDDSKNPYLDKRPIDENSGLSTDELEAYNAGLADIANQMVAIRENATVRWKMAESEAMQQIIGDSGTYLEKRLALDKKYQEDRAALVANGATKEQLDLFDEKYKENKEALFQELLGEFVGFQQQLTNAEQTYAAQRQQIEEALEKEKDPKKKKALVASLVEIEKSYKQTAKNIKREFVENNIGDVFNDQTIENIKAAKEELDKMEAMSLDEFNLAYQANLTTEEFAELKEEIGKVRNELRNLGKGYSLKDAFSDAFSGKTKEEVQRGVDYIVSGFGKVASAASSIANAMHEFADATGNAKLEQLADTFQYVADTISTAGGYAAAGAQIGGGWGAVIGAVIGIGQGVITAIFGSKADDAQRQKERENNAREYVEDITDKIGSIISSIDTLNDTVASLNYAQYQKSLLDAINELRKSTYSSGDNWRELYYASNSWDILSGNNGGTFLDDAHLVQLAEQLGAIWYAHDEVLEAIISNFTGQLTDAERELLLEYLRYRQQENNMHLRFDGNEYSTREWIRHVYADQYNNADYERDRRRLALLEEMTALYKSGSISAMDYFKIQQKADQYNLESLIAQRDRLLATEHAADSQEVIEIENQIAELTYSIQNRFKEMFEGLAGIDLQSLASKWLDIFKEFGDDMSKVFEKIDESIDDMIRNMIYQTVFIQPLIKRMNDALNAYMEQMAREQGIDTTQEGWQSLVTWDEASIRGAAESLRTVGHGISDLIGDINGAFSDLGLDTVGESSDRTAQARGIGSFSQESMDMANGTLTNINGHTFNLSENSNIIRDILRDNISAINGNIGLIRDYTQHLVRMDTDLHSMRDDLNYMRHNGTYAS